VARACCRKNLFDLPDALVAKSVLEAHGFMAVLSDWHVGSVDWSYMSALNGIRLCTLDVSLPDALRLLDERPEGRRHVPLNDDIIHLLNRYVPLTLLRSGLADPWCGKQGAPHRRR
jgi:hypothetical protein